MSRAALLFLALPLLAQDARQIVEESQRRLTHQETRQAERKRVTADLEAAARDLQDKEGLLRENRDFQAMEAQLDPLRIQERQLAERVRTTTSASRIRWPSPCSPPWIGSSPAGPADARIASSISGSIA